MKYIYKLNSQYLNHKNFNVEADNYSLDDNYFHFFESFGSGSSRKVASVRASEVLNIERVDNDSK